MAKRTRRQEFTDEDLKSVCSVAKDITLQPEFTQDDYEDVKQELLLGLYQEYKKFRSRKSNWKTFRWRLLRQLAGKIRRDRMQVSHRYMTQPTFSLNLPGETDGFCPDDHPTRMDLVTTDHVMADESKSDYEDKLALIVDVRLFIATLPREYQEICAAISEHGISGARAALRIPIATMTRRTREIRERMVTAGLDEYLQKHCQNGGARS